MLTCPGGQDGETNGARKTTEDPLMSDSHHSEELTTTSCFPVSHHDDHRGPLFHFQSHQEAPKHDGTTFFTL